MSGPWDHQLRLTLAAEAAAAARRDPGDPALAPLPEILARHRASLTCQYDAFADYVAEAERRGVEDFPLYAWTRATIEDPAKQAKYLKSFTLYVEGREVYATEVADALQAELEPLVGGGLVVGLDRYDTNPANNPQPPAQLRDSGTSR
ncbi:hypothetical protein SAMN06265365_103279 [Tistlia consotensis]|uniref:Uncharacterized protein n=1 Tax=Tistlia consotensis USBA 355 TaxID=560819 RepID=A0A1Y6C4Q4_9PROT|nr:hypothetical protein [Tistlia consotensis]SMF43193.1 hypothetical protein SAMN05428998_11541 [Tistlia consotensis USBA 355]SNR42330.1 hypothetical protein SAMN06265365_103279 [Tistlia consotensis]